MSRRTISDRCDGGHAKRSNVGYHPREDSGQGPEREEGGVGSLSYVVGVARAMAEGIAQHVPALLRERGRAHPGSGGSLPLSDRIGRGSRWLGNCQRGRLGASLFIPSGLLTGVRLIGGCAARGGPERRTGRPGAACARCRWTKVAPRRLLPRQRYRQGGRRMPHGARGSAWPKVLLRGPLPAQRTAGTSHRPFYMSAHHVLLTRTISRRTPTQEAPCVR